MSDEKTNIQQQQQQQQRLDTEQTNNPINGLQRVSKDKRQMAGNLLREFNNLISETLFKTTISSQPELLLSTISVTT